MKNLDDDQFPVETVEDLDGTSTHRDSMIPGNIDQEHADIMRSRGSGSLSRHESAIYIGEKIKESVIKEVK